ncbi:hypothetical protein ATANTOWER_030429 [Ataeniobius toweri]|uniref:Secreted protein n=1 Tax=Ataeniobius toweri TaxID=208326 RepID=A0ABU7B3K5_9TELE|nr:hypothetical protein [Ataeniobius toweri]
MGGTRFLLLMLFVGWEKSVGLNWNPVPRKTVRYQVGRGRWPLTLSLVLMEVSSCKKGVFLSIVTKCMLSMRDCCKSIQGTVDCRYMLIQEE